MSKSSQPRDGGVQSRIGRRFRDPSLLERALTHRSFAAEASEPTHDNERFEFLGDAVLGFIASDRLVRRLPEASEGRLAKMKAWLVSADALERVARRLELGAALRVGKAEEHSGGRSKKGLLVDALEALIAAVYLDGGVEAAGEVIDRLILTDEAIEEAGRNLETHNAKSTLQELLQAHRLPAPEYRLIGTSGPAHDRRFEVELHVGELFRTRAAGSPKRVAEQSAALEALERREEWLEVDRTSDS